MNEYNLVCDRVYKKKKKNVVGKGEYAGYKHFLPFPQCFLKTFLNLSQTSPGLYVSAEQAF